MIGIILIVISWGFLRIQGLSLSTLGFNKPLQRSIELIAGLLIASLFASAQFVLISYFSDFQWVLNPDFSAAMVLESLRWNLNSVLYEELIFRGYLLYKAIEIIGAKKACLLSSAAFGIYHWFSYEVLGSLVPMVYVFLITSSFGLMLAYSFAKSKSIILPIALHLGWNTITILVFSNGPLGPQLLMPSTTEPMLLTTFQQGITSLAVPFGFVIIVLWIVTKKVYRCSQLGLFHPNIDG